MKFRFVFVWRGVGWAKGVAVAALVAEIGDVDYLMSLFYFENAVFLDFEIASACVYYFLEIILYWLYFVTAVGKVWTYGCADIANFVAI
jgi:hypothetical protein